MDGKIANREQIASVRRYILQDGRARGIEVLDCDNGKLRFLLNVSKALDIMQLYHEGQSVSFLSKNGFTKREIAFERRFEGGLLYTCGLNNIGAREGFETHGFFHNTPAKVTQVECNDEEIIVRAEIVTTALFGENLVMKRTVRTELGSEVLHIEDTLANEGFQTEDYCLLYHVNVGYPMLDEGASLQCNAKAVTPRTEWAKANERAYAYMTDCVDNQEETCYFIEVNEAKLSLTNPKIAKTFQLSWSIDTLPKLIEWKSMSSGDYALGLEPCTSFLDDTFEYAKIQAKERKTMTLTIQVTNQKEKIL